MKKGHHPGGDDAPVEEETVCLGDVKAERRIHLVLVAARATTYTAPQSAIAIGVLHAHLHAAHGTVVEAIPEAGSDFESKAALVRARGRCSGCLLDHATGVVEQR